MAPSPPPLPGAPGGDTWTPRQLPNPSAAARLFCFAHAGGGSVAFAGWGRSLPSVEVCPVELPGRLTRLDRAPIDRMEVLVDLLVEEIKPFLDRPYAFYGHSLGSLVAFEVARALSSSGAGEPLVLFVAGTRPPRTVADQRRLAGRDDAELIEALRALGGTPAEILDDPDLLEFVLPAIRADMSLLENYRHAPGTALSCAIVAMAGEGDPVAGPSHLGDWAIETSGEFTLWRFRGAHFFPQEDRERVLASLERYLDSCLAEVARG